MKQKLFGSYKHRTNSAFTSFSMRSLNSTSSSAVKEMAPVLLPLLDAIALAMSSEGIWVAVGERVSTEDCVGVVGEVSPRKAFADRGPPRGWCHKLRIILVEHEYTYRLSIHSNIKIILQLNPMVKIINFEIQGGPLLL